MVKWQNGVDSTGSRSTTLFSTQPFATCIACSMGSCRFLLIRSLTWIPTIQLPVSGSGDERFSLLPKWLSGSSTLTSQVKDHCIFVDPHWFQCRSGFRDPAFNLSTDPDPLSQTNAYPCGSGSG
jgi:hypothetical protein